MISSIFLSRVFFRLRSSFRNFLSARPSNAKNANSVSRSQKINKKDSPTPRRERDPQATASIEDPKRPENQYMLRLTVGAAIIVASVASFSNVTLTSLGGDLSVVVYLPRGIKPDENTFYSASRFDHGSMIGSIKRKARVAKPNGRVETSWHTLFDTDDWRQPHNADWPESGVGLAAEFGVGDDGAFCNFMCGWNSESDVTNGLLGYQDVKLGESFLKIGVGELIKGSCPSCDSTEDYRFNSPYLFAKPPVWTLPLASSNTVRLEHQAKLRGYGYRLVKEITLFGNVLSVTNTLTNLGSAPFSTVWYSHNFFTCDSIAVGPGYSVDLNLVAGNRADLYQEPGTWSWSTPLKRYADVKALANFVRVVMKTAVEPGVRIKSEFTNDGVTNGGFTIKACDTKISSNIPQLEGPTDLRMYAYNLYIERGTLSPEPQILIRLDGGQSTTWTQQLVFDDNTPSFPVASWSAPRIGGLRSMTTFSSWPNHHAMAAFFLVCLSILFLNQLLFRGSRRRYTRIPDSLT